MISEFASTACLLLPLAGSRISEMSDHFQATTTQSPNWVALLLVIVIPLISAGFVFVVYRWFSCPAREFCAPEDILTELCRLHRLSNVDRQLLVQIASQLQIHQPATLFTNPALLRKASRQRIAASSSRINQLHRRLFG